MEPDNAGHTVVSPPNRGVDSDFIERMKICARRVGSVSALARRAGISQSGIRRYFTGGDPTRARLLAIAAAAGVRLEWLMTGALPATPEEDGSALEGRRSHVDHALLEQVIRTVSARQKATNRELAPPAMASLIAFLYRLHAERGDVDEVTVDDAIELASQGERREA